MQTTRLWLQILSYVSEATQLEADGESRAVARRRVGGEGGRERVAPRP